MKTFIIGASGSLGRALATTEALNKSDLVLVASDPRDLKALQSDLMLRFDIKVEIIALNLSKTLSTNDIQLDGDRYYFPVGFTLDKDFFGIDAQDINKVFQVNLFSMSELVSRLMGQDRDKTVDIIGFGSIAQTRGRSSNVFYSAAKRSLTSLFESLLHSCQQNNVRPYLFQIGYMNSQLSFGKKLLFPIAEPEDVAKNVLKTLNHKNPGIFYVPGFWVFICFALKLLPWPFYRKLKF